MFSSCKKDDESNKSKVEQITSTTTSKKDVEEVETVFEEVDEESQDNVEPTEERETQTAYIDVTDKEGNDQTSKVEYSVMGGSDPYVEDIF